LCRRGEGEGGEHLEGAVLAADEAGPLGREPREDRPQVPEAVGVAGVAGVEVAHRVPAGAPISTSYYFFFSAIFGFPSAASWFRNMPPNLTPPPSS